MWASLTLNYNSNSRIVFESVSPSNGFMSIELNRPPKPEDSQKNSNFNGKTIPYSGFEPGTSGLAVGSHNHCTIGSVNGFIYITYYIYDLRVFGIFVQLNGG
jgi:hypothetical protein